MPPKRTTTAPVPKPKRNRLFDARKILTQAPPDPAVGKNGDFDVAAFIKAREFEIHALRQSMEKSKKALSSRAFQEVPRHLRRRMASHNVKKVPKRLRSRATREMQDDHTPTGKARAKKLTTHQRLRLAKSKGLTARKAAQKPLPTTRPPNALATTPKSPKYARRQIHKCWLPTHVWHAKRSRMTEPKHPLWRFALALTPTEKCFRSTHRAASARGCVVTDTSYMATIRLWGSEKSLLNVFCALGVDPLTFDRRGSRFCQVWLRAAHVLLAPALVLWHPPNPEALDKRQLLLRVHPSAFPDVWAELVKLGKMQRPPVLLEDLRFEIASIQVTGPGSTEALAGCLRPSDEDPAGVDWNESDIEDPVLEDLDELLEMEVVELQPLDQTVKSTRPMDQTVKETRPAGQTVQSTPPIDQTVKETRPADQTVQSSDPTDDKSVKIWQNITALSNPATLPPNVVLPLTVSDPRLRYPPRQIRPAAPDDAFLKMLIEWPLDKDMPNLDIFDAKIRKEACRRLSSQKAINRRKGEADRPPPLATDPRIPILLAANRAGPRAQGTWTVLLPWDCTLPIWYHLVHYPLSTGGTPRFGGLDQTQQLAFEQGRLWFPGDFPATAAGQAWEALVQERSRQEWERRPKGKRPEYESLNLGIHDEAGVNRPKGELGRGWACDWDLLGDLVHVWGRKIVRDSNDIVASIKSSSETDSVKFKADTPFGHESDFPVRSTTDEGSSEDKSGGGSKLVEAPSENKSGVETKKDKTPENKSGDGNKTDKSVEPGGNSARERQMRPLCPIEIQVPARGHPQRCARIYRLPANEEWRRRWLAPAQSSKSLPVIASSGEIQTARAEHAPIPLQEDLVGFVTSANYDLGQGNCRAFGSVLGANLVQRDSGKCIFRNAGETVGRLAEWQWVDP